MVKCAEKRECPICGDDPLSRYFSGSTTGEMAFAPCEHLRVGREIDEAVGVKTVSVTEWDLGGENVEAFCLIRGKTLHVAIEERLPDVSKRAREIEAHGLSRFVPRPLWRRLGGRMFSTGMWCCKAEKKEHVAPATVLAVAAVIADMEPEWLERIEEARAFADDERVMAAWSGLPLQIVVGGLARIRAEEAAIA